MRRIINHPRLKNLPIILETPELETMLETNLNMVRELQGKLSGGATKIAQAAQSSVQAAPTQQSVLPNVGTPDAAPAKKRSTAQKSSTKRSTGREHEDASFV
jgi:hypothetical protein